MICIECGGTAINNTELCENCLEVNRPEAVSLDMVRQRDMSMSCAACQRMIFSDSKQCTNCRKSYHVSCDSSEGLTLNGYVCSTCHRRNQVLNDDMMLPISSTAPHREQNAPLSPFSDSTVHQISLQMPTGPMTSGYPSNPDFGEMYTQMTGSSIREHNQQHGQQMMTQTQLMDEISDGGATNDSDRNSSPFYQETSDYDEDFVPVSSRGRGRGGGGKKKPGRGQSTGSRRQTNPGPTGYFSAVQVRAMGDIPQPTSTRGKRGKRGNGTATPRQSGKGPGRGRGRGRGSSMQISSVLQQQPQHDAIMEVDESMLDDENSRQSGGSRTDGAEYHRMAVVCRVNDEFLQKACLCLMCGGVGKGEESSMIACSNCAQTYHTYCVNLHEKFNPALTKRGWRCLDCLICEGCGNGGDETKLMLCEECDVSNHCYCIKPPLDKVPSGPYRCQWCIRCRRCNHKSSSGSDLTAKGFCQPCASLLCCPRCEKRYQLNDKIIRCSQCNKWQHGVCEGLHTDEQLEQAAINRMRCASCRPNRLQNNVLSDADAVWCDHVALDKEAHEILKSKYTPSALKNHMMETVGYRESFDHYDEDYAPLEDAVDPSGLAAPLMGQRGRGRGNPSGRRGMNRIGVGGFYAKLPRHRIQALNEEAAAAAADDDDNKKAKRPRKPRRSQLEDAYPPQIQEAFFGIKAVEGKNLVETAVDEPALSEFKLKIKKKIQ
uniref:PHD-type domain-containing protein n=1 Tax=Caenorhabditis tropicalis TaxID=1561998 RepID=A0A1I7TLY4_9PELO